MRQVDVVIVGGGLAGLSAAQELRGENALLLERANRLGGRVLTNRWGETRYELGALFAYDPRWLPSGNVGSRLVRARPRVGVSIAGEVTLGDTIDDVVRRLQAAGGPTRDAGLDGEPPQAVKRAFFGAIHPGDMDRYLPERQRDWSATFATDHHVGGNEELVHALAKGLEGRVALGAEVTRIVEDREGFVVVYREAGRQRRVRSRAVVLATPAVVAARLLTKIAPDHQVHAVRYAPGVVVAIGTDSAKLSRFTYVVAAEGALTSVFSTLRGSQRILTLYYAGSRARAVAKLSRDELLAQAMRALNGLGVGVLTRDDVRFFDSEVWSELGTIVGPDPYGSLAPGFDAPAPGLFLAGDYTFWNEAKMPYGMGAAVASGKSAGRAAHLFLTERRQGAR